MATTKPSRRDYEPKHVPKHSRAVRKARVKKPLLKRWWFWLLATPIILGILASGAIVIAYVRIDLPEALPPIRSTYLYDRNGQLLTRLHGAVDRTVIPFSQMPEHFREAVLAVEDHAFYEHGGFDPMGIVRAAYTDLVRRETVQGASTITQQLVKNVYAGRYLENPETGATEYATPERSIKEKIREVLLAVKLEQELTKDQILAKYLNTVYFGHGAYGIEAAAQTYFDKPASELSVLESAVLAGVLERPVSRDPIDRPSDNRFRRDYALDQMVLYGYLDDETRDRLKDKPCCSIPKRILKGPDERIVSPLDSEYFVEHTRRVLFDRYGSAVVYGGGLRITTSLDLDLQKAAEAAVDAHLPDKDDPRGALVAIDPRNGQILAMVGGREWAKSKVNLATFPCVGCGRQAGSAFKVFTLAAAMQERYSLNATWAGPNQISIDDPRCADASGESWMPTNAEGSGTYSLKAATAHSVNTIFAQLVSQLGPRKVVKMAHRLGIRSDLAELCSITLGSVAINPLEMTNGYATIAARGVRHWATPLRRVLTQSGRRFDDVREAGKQVIQTNDADLVTYALQEVVRAGTGSAASLGSRPVAGKTGTAQDNVDAWFCGYTPRIATCVWVGFPKAEIPLLNINGVPAVYGGTIPAAIWQDFMTVAVAGDPVETFATPSFEGYTEGPAKPVFVPPSPSPSPSPSPEPTGPTGPTGITGPTGPGGTGPTGPSGVVVLVPLPLAAGGVKPRCRPARGRSAWGPAATWPRPRSRGRRRTAR